MRMLRRWLNRKRRNRQFRMYQLSPVSARYSDNISYKIKKKPIQVLQHCIGNNPVHYIRG